MGSVAAPLLAGFSLTVATLVLTATTAFRWPNVVLGALVVAIAAFVAAVQFAFRARLYAVTPSQIEEWYPNASANRRTMMRREQRLYRSEYRRWSDRSRSAYNVGLVTLGLGLASALIPPDFTEGRQIVFGLALVGVVVECLWIGHGEFAKHPSPALPEVGPELS